MAAIIGVATKKWLKFANKLPMVVKWLLQPTLTCPGQLVISGSKEGIDEACALLKEAGAKEIYMCISSPTIEYSCHYGIDTSVRKELIAATHTVDEIKDYIHADKLHYLSR